MSRLVGPWDQLTSYLSKMPYTSKTAACRGLAKSATAYQRLWKSAVKTDALGLRRKAGITLASMGGKSTPLVWQGDYAVGIKKLPKGNRADKYFVGVFSGMHKRTKMPLVKLALVQEYGWVIRPKKSKVLTIPATKRARFIGPASSYPWKKGEPIFIPYRGGKSTHTVGGFYETFRAGKGNKNIRMVYLLVRQIKIEKRPAMAMTWRQFRKAVPYIVAKEVGLSIRQRVKKFARERILF